MNMDFEPNSYYNINYNREIIIISVGRFFSFSQNKTRPPRLCAQEDYRIIERSFKKQGFMVSKLRYFMLIFLNCLSVQQSYCDWQEISFPLLKTYRVAKSRRRKNREKVLHFLHLRLLVTRYKIHVIYLI